MHAIESRGGTNGTIHLPCSWILQKGRKSSWSKQHLNLHLACLVHFIVNFSSPFKL
uniref:Uncharacterized protein n=1 Tax=Arundo donax TaxID=35708 RepID=A0A0A9F6U0_ARUDO